MPYYDLNETLTAFLEAFDIPPGSGITIEEAELNVPLEIKLEGVNGVLRVYAQPAASAYHSGFESLVHRARIVAGSIENEERNLDSQWLDTHEDSHDSRR